jgi:MYXO-CTERM domain-containing protein
VCAGQVKVCAGEGGFVDPDFTQLEGFEADTEATCDGLDNDCDGENDEELTAPAASLTQGLCAGQVQVCAGEGGFVDPDFTQIEGFEADTEARCDGLDNDCDGESDEELTAPAASLTEGVCTGQVQVCTGEGGFVDPDFTQIAGFEADAEISCDALDNDCDGESDEELDAPAASLTAGVCADQVQVCDGENGFVEPDYTQLEGFEAGEELSCDGLDNDCDGGVDEDLDTPAASLTEGVCAGQNQVCDGEGGGFIDPDYTQLEGFEGEDEKSCDGLDNDCDGEVDEALTAPPADLSEGVCEGLVKVCGGVDGFVEPSYDDVEGFAAEELCGDSLDNNCDGAVDEGCDDEMDDDLPGENNDDGSVTVVSSGAKGGCSVSVGGRAEGALPLFLLLGFFWAGRRRR